MTEPKDGLISRASKTRARRCPIDRRTARWQSGDAGATAAVKLGGCRFLWWPRSANLRPKTGHTTPTLAKDTGQQSLMVCRGSLSKLVGGLRSLSATQLRALIHFAQCKTEQLWNPVTRSVHKSLISPHLIWPHFTGTECIVIGRRHGKLGRFRALSVQMKWNQMRWDEMGDMNGLERLVSCQQRRTYRLTHLCLAVDQFRSRKRLFRIDLHTWKMKINRPTGRNYATKREESDEIASSQINILLEEALQIQKDRATRHKYEISHLKRLAIEEWPLRTFKVIAIAPIR